MNLSFPLSDVVLEIGTEKREVENPLYEEGMFSVGLDAIRITIENEGILFITMGKKIEIFPAPGVMEENLQRSLTNWGLVGILHQRKLLNFHSSAVAWKGQGIMICGDSGAGKSSLTAALCLEGAQFISDDITVVDFVDDKPFILPLENQLALRTGTVNQIPAVGIATGINPVTGKYLFEFPLKKEQVPLSQIYWITPFDGEVTSFVNLHGVQKFSTLRGEICAWEMLKGMPETEQAYLEKLLTISSQVPLSQIKRYRDSRIKDFAAEVIRHLERNASDSLVNNNE